jgi:hypothetical protein
MIHEPCTLVAAIRDYFTDSKKVEISEFKALTYKDKVELREMMIAVGYDVMPLTAPPQES